MDYLKPRHTVTSFRQLSNCICDIINHVGTIIVVTICPILVTVLLATHIAILFEKATIGTISKEVD
jgi:hypothetical protein